MSEERSEMLEKIAKRDKKLGLILIIGPFAGLVLILFVFAIVSFVITSVTGA